MSGLWDMGYGAKYPERKEIASADRQAGNADLFGRRALSKTNTFRQSALFV